MNRESLIGQLVTEKNNLQLKFRGYREYVMVEFLNYNQDCAEGEKIDTSRFADDSSKYNAYTEGWELAKLAFKVLEDEVELQVSEFLDTINHDISKSNLCDEIIRGIKIMQSDIKQTTIDYENGRYSAFCDVLTYLYKTKKDLNE